MTRGRHHTDAPRDAQSPDARLPRRFAQLLAGLALYGTSMTLLVQGGLGVMPWDVLHQGIAARSPLSMGTVTVVVGAVVLAAWVPLRQGPGPGTVLNVLVIGACLDGTRSVVPVPGSPAVRILYLVLGIVLNGVATAAYIGADLGPGPRDGLMTGLVARTGLPLWRVRTGIELGVVLSGHFLGGVAGAGTVVYALGIGPLVHRLLPAFAVAHGDHSRAA